MTNTFPTPDQRPSPAAAAELSGRTALVTGGGSGIGRACALALAQAGAFVHVVDRDADSAKAVAEIAGGQAQVADLADPGAIGLLPTEIDILVNNAGLQHVAPLTEFPPDRFELIQKVMVTAPFLLMQRTLPHMYARGWGRVVNVSSVHGLRASAFKSAYVTAKHALEGLSKVAAIEGAPHGVTSNCVNPGYVRTPLVEGQIRDQAAAHGISEGDVLSNVLLARSPVKRLLEADEVAAAVLWLCGPHSGYLTGASLPLDGGWTAG
ncbi:3-hydroxybutyrate dehydrogenase [Streptomyces gardneri]|uniref:3-hydroxybutyrate dehydrogenase n=1 Tax=Streptomyces gardneri TaxID=66892 RepID=A0A4Y3RGD7_9ACTN|nr:3-hydroxybutyrate dehydrogenase [Streptomyces gardneri]ALO13322.1 3-hydroxybutyrate dehydrogenase [Streptomyces venezuelae]QPK49973.1 3-hydroxybutyrate dehydrogenase [Streptomyces gardneri]WRK41546.1 3-hydroxybutyrate dehydrogenase [Streptomyces venezuelae]CUM35982.1 D-beta-hydroxybutyrate dehydrogenase [Streptomyces venezuelae]GEB55743.1 3-hydroxybutyrate dehydrogenase [Streptomyces gardneri]